MINIKMEIKFSEKTIELEKELNSLDKLAINFTSILNKLEIKYVIISGYVAILFGRNRSSEDIDIIIEKMSHEKFSELWQETIKNFECIITSKPDEAYKDYLLTNSPIRFSEIGKFVPNIEIKLPKTDLDIWTLENSKEVLLNKNKIIISQIELQISFKFFLGSEKDIEDAKYLYEVFKDNLDMNLVKEFNRKLKIEKIFNKYIK